MKRYKIRPGSIAFFAVLLGKVFAAFILMYLFICLGFAL